MKKKSKKFNLDIKTILKFIVAILLGSGIGFGVDFIIRPSSEPDKIFETSFSIHLSDSQKPTILETLEGNIEVLEAPTVESVDGNQSTECLDEECGLGAFIYAPTDSPESFKNYTLGNCYDTDGFPQDNQAQCWDLGDVFWQNYAGRRLSTCGTGMARGIWNCKEEVAGDDFLLITDINQLQSGDWIIFDSGQYGHIGMALGTNNNGYIALLGQNQGGARCSYGGMATNIINISLSSFKGAFRPKTYQKQPEPVPISNCIEWMVEKGDTMSQVMLECENTLVYGEAMNAYARTWFSMDFVPNQSVYDGWKSPSGVGLYAGDRIEHRF